jgi:uncharacterized protein DUF2795
VASASGRRPRRRPAPPSIFPARPDRLVEEARSRFADDSVVATLERLPDREYETVGQVWDAIQGE